MVQIIRGMETKPAGRCIRMPESCRHEWPYQFRTMRLFMCYQRRASCDKRVETCRQKSLKNKKTQVESLKTVARDQCSWVLGIDRVKRIKEREKRERGDLNKRPDMDHEGSANKMQHLHARENVGTNHINP